MNNQLFIITGGSRGLGKSLAMNAVNRGDQVITLSRSKSFVADNHIPIICDLSRPKQAIKRLERILDKQKLKLFSKIHLIHNAALLEPICSITKAKVTDIESHINVNLLAPLLLSKFFMQKTRALKNDQTMTFISSGAARFTIANWTLYCTTKAGLRMLAESLALENSNSHLKIFSFSPGLMDTRMQKQLRNKKTEDFPMLQQFKDYQNQGLLISTDRVAKALLDMLNQPEIYTKVNYRYESNQVQED
jgi:benzil reductase ((S)-benzoin forming)